MPGSAVGHFCIYYRYLLHVTLPIPPPAGASEPSIPAFLLFSLFPTPQATGGWLGGSKTIGPWQRCRRSIGQTPKRVHDQDRGHQGQVLAPNLPCRTPTVLVGHKPPQEMSPCRHRSGSSPSRRQTHINQEHEAPFPRRQGLDTSFSMASDTKPPPRPKTGRKQLPQFRPKSSTTKVCRNFRPSTRGG